MLEILQKSENLTMHVLKFHTIFYVVKPVIYTPTSRNYQLYDTSLPGSKKQTSSYTLLKQKGCFNPAEFAA